MIIIQEFPNYSIDKNGVVVNTKTNRIMKQQTYHGYKYVQLNNDGKTKMLLVHRLVAMAFIPNPDNLPCVNHKDENKENNSVENLEWCTHSYNNYFGKAKPTVKAQEARKKEVEQYTKDGKKVAVYESACEAQRKTGICQANISKCCLKRKGFLSAGGYVWKFKN